MLPGARDEQRGSECFWPHRKRPTMRASWEKSTKWEEVGWAPWFQSGQPNSSMPLWPKQYFQVGAGEGYVITFRRRQEIQKIVEMKKIPKRRSMHLVQLCTLLTRRKVPALLASCLMPLSTLFTTSLCPPLPSPLVVSLFLLSFFFPVFTWFSFPPFALTSSYISSLPHHTPSVGKKEETELSIGLRVDRAGIQGVAPAPQVTSGWEWPSGEQLRLPLFCSLLLWTNWTQMTQALKCSSVCVHS